MKPDRRSPWRVYAIASAAFVVGIASILLLTDRAPATPGAESGTSPDKERVRGAMRATLRNLMTSEARFFAEYGAYTTQLEKLKEQPDEPLDVPAGIAVSVDEVTDRGWFATARIVGVSGLVCSIRVGETRLGSRIAREGEPVCE